MSNRYDWAAMYERLRCEATDRRFLNLLPFIDRMVRYVNETAAPGRNHALRVYGRLQKSRRLFLYMIESGFNLSHREITSKFIAAMSSSMQKELSTSSVADIISHLSCFYDHLLRKGEVKANPVKRRHYVKVIRPKQKVIKPEEVMRYANMLARVGDFDSLTYAMALALCANTGLRLQEIWLLKPTDFVANDPKLGPHLVVMGKKNQERTVPLKRAFAGLLWKYIRKFCGQAEGDFLFHEPMGTDHPMHIKRFTQRLAQVRKEDTSLPVFTVTAARRGFATELFARGMSIEQLMALYDHSRSQMTLRYIDREELVQARAVKEHHPLFRERKVKPAK